MKKANILSWFLILTLLLASCCTGSLAEDAESLFSLKDLSIMDPQEAIPLELDGENVTITEAGVYLVSGTIQDGQLSVDLDEEGTVYLLLNGVTISNSSGSALHIDDADKVILTLMDGTVNTFTQGDGEPEASKNKAAIYSSSDLTINGTGTLIVNGNYADGINCRDKLRIVSGTLAVTAVKDAITGKDAVCIGGGNITVVSLNGDAIQATNSDDADLGYITICGGMISVTTGDGAGSVEFQEEFGWGFGFPGMEASSTDSSDTPSQKGLKAETSITISAGSITADTVDDAIHAADVTISDGVLTLSSGDDGIHADNTLSISGGTVSILTSYEGIEATELFLEGGELSIIAFDDGVNAAGGDAAETSTDSDTAESFMGWHGMDMFSSSTGTLVISGGEITVISSGDGVDVNGDFTMTGGTLLVRGSEDAMNAALDYDGTFTLSGGTVIAVGASGMAQGVTSPSIPGAMISASSGTLSVASADGTTLLSCTFDGIYDNAVIYSDLFTENETYLVTTGDTTQSVVMTTEATIGNTMGCFGGGRGGMGNGFGGFGGGRGGQFGDWSQGAPEEFQAPQNNQ